MKITPLEIRQKTFERALRGYDKDEVNAFLMSMSQEWERSQNEVKEMKMKFDAAEKEVTKLREVESTLYRTLKTAEDTGANVIDQANKSAELILRESQMKADAMVNEAKNKARNVIEEAEQTTRQLLEEMEAKLKSLADQYKTMELHRDNLLSDLKRLAGETMDRVERVKNMSREFDPDKFLNIAKREARKVVFPNEIEQEAKRVLARKEPVVIDQKVPVVTEQKIPLVAEQKIPVVTEQKIPVTEARVPRSFFDDIQ